MTDSAEAAISPVVQIKTYQRTKRPFPTRAPPATAEFWTMGYLDDACLTFPGVACMTRRNPTRMRPEASAQALTLWVLAALLNDQPIPLVGRKGYEFVDWEVGPTKEIDAPDGEPPGDPNRDPCDPTPGPKLPTRWRIDIAVQRSTIIEVKNYQKRSEVENQLACYEAAAVAQHQVDFGRNTTLEGNVFPFAPINAIGNSPQDATVWCVWYPEGPTTEGHAYFARLVETPQPQQDQCNPNPAGGNNPALNNDTVIDTMEKLIEALIAALGAAAAAMIRKHLRPAPVPAHKRVTSGASTTYQINAAMLPDQARLLNVDWGDGTTSTVNVPIGTGVHTASFNKIFTNTGIGVRRLNQQVGISENNALGPSSVVAPGDPSFDFVTDVDPAPHAESDPDGDPATTLTVDPGAYLLDGQTVRVSGAGFHPNSTGALRICNTGDTQVCTSDLATYSTNGSGAFGPVQVGLVRTFSHDGVAIDCGIVACRLAGNTLARYASHQIAFGDVVSRPPPADLDGSGTTDISLYRPSAGAWHVRDRDTTFLGQASDLPVPCDYNSDGRDDIAVYRPSIGWWFIRDRPTVFFGTAGDVPVPADYDGNGTCDIAVFRPSVGGWFILGQPTVFFGASGDIPVPGDYDGNGTADIAVFRPSVGGWYRPGATTTFFGLSGDIPVPGDFDGYGLTAIAVFRPSVGGWYQLDGPTVSFGHSGDRPLPLPSAVRQVFFP
ncbi:MAG: neocarzinostatin apoprotein domain-containing protein [Acidimicrobiales bacterium]